MYPRRHHVRPGSRDRQGLGDLFEPVLGLVFGGGIEFLFGGLKVELDARYNSGLTHVNGSTSAGSVSLENRGWSFSVGLGKLLD
jgi:hypothetical protein